jgi:hypothetical protein
VTGPVAPACATGSSASAPQCSSSTRSSSFRPATLFFHVVMRRNATREIVQVNFQTVHGRRTWAVSGNHWQSRSGGQFESAGYRHIARETLGYFHQ